jgi:hypothetical protein
MQGAPKRQVNVEEMLAELKQALESSPPAPNATSLSASALSTPSGRDNQRSHWGVDLPVKVNADSSIGRPDLQTSSKSNSRRWKLTAGGLALAGVAAVGASYAFMNKAPTPPAHELSAATAEGLVTPQNEPTIKPTNDSGSLVGESRQAAPLQAGALETRPDATAVPANGGAVSAQGKAGVGASNVGPSGLESAPPAFTLLPPSSAAVPVATQAIRLDGTPIATAPTTPASTGSAPPTAEAPKPAAPSAGPQTVKPDAAPVATARSTPASTDSSPPPAETPKPSATPTASLSNESAAPPSAKIDAKKKASGKIALQKPRKSAKASAKSLVPPERQPTEPAPAKEAVSSPQPAQGASNPTPVAPAAPPSVPQRFADGVTHAFGYLIGLPGSLVPH